MGEAWFMGEERRLFKELMTERPDQWSLELIEVVLQNLASGPGCFGHLQEWTDWLHFLIPLLLVRIDDRRWADTYESMVSAFIAQYPDERSAPLYKGFFSDVLATLGRIPMLASNWNDGRLADGKVISSVESTASGLFISCGGALSAGLFLNLRYLEHDHVAAWLASVFAIKDPLWQAKLVLWMARSRALLVESGRQPAALRSEHEYGSGWQESWSLKGANPSPKVDKSQVAMPFLSEVREQQFRDELRHHLNPPLLKSVDNELAELQRGDEGMYSIRVLFDAACGEIVNDYKLG